MAASYSPVEKAYFDQLFALVDKDSTGVLPGQDTLPFLVSSNLPQQTLGEVWAIADPDNNGFLTRESWYRAARLIGWIQKGGQSKPDESLFNKSGPLPTFSGYPPPPEQPTVPSTPKPAEPSPALPPLTPADRAKFTRIFVGCGPSNGLVSGDKARDVFLKSQLSYDKLGLIWNLADTQQRGSLDLTDFVIGMYLIQSSMANPALVLPQTLPPGLYEVASGGRSLPVSTAASPVMRQNTGPASPIQRQYTGGTLQPQRTGQSFTAPPPASTPPRPTASSFSTSSAVPTSNFAPRAMSAPWDVTPEAKAASDRFFAQLDTQNRGVIEGDIAVPFMLQSQLDEATLASVWDLSDIRQEGKLDRDEFAVAMHLINSKLAGQPLPTKLPDSLVPPSLRSLGGQPPVSQPSASRDLFDLMDDSPAPAPPPAVSTPTRQPAPAPPSQLSHVTFAPQPPPAPSPAFMPARPQNSDLLGDDAAETRAAPVPDTSAEVGNKLNQLNNTERSAADLEKTRGELEQATKSGQEQLQELESKLSAARVKHEAESKAVADLRIRVAEQTTKLKQLEAETISAESDLTAMRLEKDELEQTLLKDKEEVRGLQKRMKEVEDEKTGMKLLLEKIKKEARQQKGMVSIAKKQVSTAEASRDTLQQDIRAAEKEAEEPEEPIGIQSPAIIAAATGVPLPATPNAISPEPTGVSQRSNNPFDRFKSATPITSPHETTSPSAGILGVGAAVGAAAGVVAAGATTLFSAAKDAVAPEYTEETQPKEVDPFGVPTSTEETAHHDQSDPFQASEAEHGHATAADSGFDDSFGKEFSAAPVASTGATPVPATSQGMSDFDSAFADLHGSAPAVPEEEALGGAEPEIAGPPIPSGIPKSALPVDVRPDVERSLSTQAVAPTSLPHTPASEPRQLASDGEEPAAPSTLANEVQAEEPSAPEPDSSDDEEEGPEDVEGPRRGYTTSSDVQEFDPTATLAPPITSPSSSTADNEAVAKVRRSAPPPPAAKSSVSDSFVSAVPEAPIAAVVPAAPAAVIPAAPAPVESKFEDADDFDFADLPAADVEKSTTDKPAAPSAAFDDEFAGFDDDFEKPSSQNLTGSDQSGSHTFEMVSPHIPQSASGQQSSGRAYDEWGMSSGPKKTEAPAPSSANALSFDDAFGGDFEPAQIEEEQVFAPPPGPPPAHLSAPPLPDRRLSEQRSEQPQEDDLEDVKRLCAMGFSRTLAVEALDANGYEFQKALNILLAQ